MPTLGGRVHWHLEEQKECNGSLLCLLLLRCCHPCQISPVGAPLLQVHFLWSTYRHTYHPKLPPPQLQPWPKKSSAGDSWVQLWCLADGKEVTMLTCQSMSFLTKLLVYSNQARALTLTFHWTLMQRFHDHAGIKRMTPYLAPFIQKVC